MHGGIHATTMRGGFPSIRHNKLRDITTVLLTEVCHSVDVELTLQPLTAWRAIFLQICQC